MFGYASSSKEIIATARRPVEAMTLHKRAHRHPPGKGVHPEWHPQEPRPLVVFSEWQLPHDIFGYSPEYYYQFRFRMTTRDDLFLDAVPMVWGPDKVPPVTCVEAEAGRRSSSSRRLRGVVL
ncbi:hypothetical protein TNCV_4426041, partial [Trichonephila clavipes]